MLGLLDTVVIAIKYVRISCWAEQTVLLFKNNHLQKVY